MNSFVTIRLMNGLHFKEQKRKVFGQRLKDYDFLFLYRTKNNRFICKRHYWGARIIYRYVKGCTSSHHFPIKYPFFSYAARSSTLTSVWMEPRLWVLRELEFERRAFDKYLIFNNEHASSTVVRLTSERSGLCHVQAHFRLVRK